MSKKLATILAIMSTLDSIKHINYSDLDLNITTNQNTKYKHHVKKKNKKKRKK